MTAQERQLILSNVGVEFTRAFLVDKAREHYRQGSSGISGNSRKAVAEFFAQNENEFVAVLRSLLVETGREDDRFLNSELRSRIAELGGDVEVPSTSKFGKTILRTFPRAKGFNSNGSRGYKCLRLA